MAELLDRAQALLAAGPYDARAAEIAAVHAAIYPERDAVCQTCRGELGKAYYAIQRWAAQQGAASDAPLSLSIMKKNVSVARFKSDNTIYTPHGLGVAYSNANLTDKAARYILANDPDAAGLFSELPPEASEEDEQASPAVTPAPALAPPTVAAGEIDYVKLAQAIVDIQKAQAPAANSEVAELTQEAKENVQPLPSATSTLTASAGGAAEAQPEVKKEELPNGVEMTTGTTEVVDENHDEQPVRLSRMNKDQLLETYRAELRLEPAAGLTNDQLRDAIAEHRAGQADPE